MFDDIRFDPRAPLRPSVALNFSVDKLLLSSGHENRNARTASARRSYILPVGQRPLAELNEIMDFFIARGGPLRAFRFRDPFMPDTGINGAPITAADVQVGIGDGSNAHFQLLEANGRIITKPVEGTVLVALDGVALSPGAYDVDPGTGRINLASVPPVGAVVSAGCVFDVPVRFQNDTLTVQQTQAGAGEINDLTLIEIFQ